MLSEVLGPSRRHGDNRWPARFPAALDEAEVGRVLPDRETRARRSPGLHRLGVRALTRADPLEQIEDQAVDGLGHGTSLCAARPVSPSTDVHSCLNVCGTSRCRTCPSLLVPTRSSSACRTFPSGSTWAICRRTSTSGSSRPSPRRSRISPRSTSSCRMRNPRPAARAPRRGRGSAARHPDGERRRRLAHRPRARARHGLQCPRGLRRAARGVGGRRDPGDAARARAVARRAGAPRVGRHRAARADRPARRHPRARIDRVGDRRSAAPVRRRDHRGGPNRARRRSRPGRPRRGPPGRRDPRGHPAADHARPGAFWTRGGWASCRTARSW